MKILALELSTSRGTLAWLNSNERPAGAPAAAREDARAAQNCDADFREWPNDRKNSAAFFENLDVVTKKFGVPVVIIVGLGPGSYAGTRIAISAAIGLQSSSGARLIGLPSICAIETTETDYCVIGDARRKSFFFARISGNELMEGPDLFGEEGLKSKLASLRNHTPIFCSESLSQFSQAMIRYPSAQLLARLAQGASQNFKLSPLEPMYLREPYVTMANPATRPTIGQ
jgi:tRNA threonylcarbamoyl adenosine modification protein YeaZ